MNTVLWTLQGLLAVAFLGVGLTHLLRSKEALAANPQMAWTARFDQRSIRLIGLAEVAGALGLVLPGLLNVLPVLVPWAALGLGLLMAGAVATHLRLRDAFAPSLVLCVLSLVVFIGRGWLERL